MRKVKIFFIFLVIAFSNKLVFAQELLQLQGSLDFVNRTLKLEIQPESGIVELDAKLEDNSNFVMNIKLKHVKIGLFDILAEVYSYGRIYFGENKIIERVKINVDAVNLLVNHRPIENLFTSCQIDNHILKINSFKGFNTILIGYLDLHRPYNLDVLAKFQPFSLLDFAEVFNRENPNIIGEIEGRFKLEGMLFFPHLKASFIIYNGQIEKKPFKEAVINFEGAYPIVRFVESKVLDDEEYLWDLKGFLDMSKLDNLESPFHNFKLEPTGNKVRLADWDLIKKDISAKEFTFRKEVDDSLSVAFESYIKDETKYRDHNDDAFEVRYKLNNGPDLNMKLKQDEGTLGIEKRIEF